MSFFIASWIDWLPYQDYPLIVRIVYGQSYPLNFFFLLFQLNVNDKFHPACQNMVVQQLTKQVVDSKDTDVTLSI